MSQISGINTLNPNVQILIKSGKLKLCQLCFYSIYQDESVEKGELITSFKLCRETNVASEPVDCSAFLRCPRTTNEVDDDNEQICWS